MPDMIKLYGNRCISQIFITPITENLTTFFLKSLFINMGLLVLYGKNVCRKRNWKKALLVTVVTKVSSYCSVSNRTCRIPQSENRSSNIGWNLPISALIDANY